MLFIIVLSIIFVVIDQISKQYVLNNMFLGQRIEMVKDFFYITSHRNRGAAWGIFQDARIFFIVTTTIFLVALVYYLLKNIKTLNLVDKILFSLIFGGAIGNFIDRVKSGEVVDFLDFIIFSYNFPIFNFADTFICIGVGLLLIKVYREEE